MVLVRVCDAIMGSGKSSAAIAYMNEHKDQKFVYITPYLDEAKRIRDGCPELDFVEPSNKIGAYDYRKMTHTAALIKEGRNITTTHQAFKRYTPETLDDIRRHGYTLIADENVDTLEKFEYSPGDLRVLVEAGYVKADGDSYKRTNKVYTGNALREIYSLLESREIIRTEDEDMNAVFFWTLPRDLFLAFKDVYILTYLFEGQSLHHFLTIYGIPYTRIGILRTEGGYRFTEGYGDTPEYVRTLRERIHIMDSDKLNDIGAARTALSMNWFKARADMAEQLKNNIGNYYRHIWEDVPKERRLWGSFVSTYNQIRGKGYSNSFLPFNAKSTNAYRKCDHLVYAANVFMNVNEKKFYKEHGIIVDEDEYSLSVMVQWIWRSAIRDGNDIWVYIPSKRMRELLIGWVNRLADKDRRNT